MNHELKPSHAALAAEIVRLRGELARTEHALVVAIGYAERCAAVAHRPEDQLALYNLTILLSIVRETVTPENLCPLKSEL
ncbi:MAG: hypothetical protein AB9869_16660 [Verrucomicrobiia bacterium]